MFIPTPCDTERSKYETVTHMGMGLVLRGQSVPRPKGVGASVLPNSGVPLFMPTSLTQNEKIRRGNTWGRILGGQPRRCLLHKCVAWFVSDSRVFCSLRVFIVSQRRSSVPVADCSRSRLRSSTLLHGKELNWATELFLLPEMSTSVVIMTYRLSCTLPQTNLLKS